MAGNSNRRGAVRRTSKGPTAGSGGRVRRGLEGRGPTPKAADREGHKAYRAERRAEDDRDRTGNGGSGRTGGRGSGRGPGRGPGRPRDRGDTEWVAGRNSVVEALRARLPVTAVYVAEGPQLDDRRDTRIREVFREVADRGIALLEVSRGELDRLTDGATHQGLAAKVPPYEYADPDDLLDRAAEAGEQSLLVALDSVTDPRNLGAVVRSAAGFGAHGVVVPERRAAGMTASAWKTSAGAAARVPVARTVNLTRQLKAYQDAGAMVIGLAADGEVDLPDLDPDLVGGPLVLVVGSEGDGLSRLVAQTCDQLVSIPMQSALESLNAGVAAGVALYAVAQARLRAGR